MTTYFVPVSLKVWLAAEAALGDAFDGTANQLDQWATQNQLDPSVFMISPNQAAEDPERYLWTAYLA